MALSAALLARLKRLYLEGEIPYADLVEMSGLDRFEFQREVKEAGWGPRPKSPASETEPAKKPKAVGKGTSTKVTKTAPTKTVAVKPKVQKPKLASKRKALIERIYAAIESELSKLEKQQGNKSQDRERASRALSQVVNSYRNASLMHDEMIKSAAGGKTNTKSKGRMALDKEALAHAEDLRRELAERIERLRMQRTANK